MKELSSFLSPRLKDISRYKPGKPIEEVQRIYKLERIYKLGSNENLLSPPEPVIEALCQESKNVNFYPDDSIYYLTSAMARKLSVEPNMLTWGSGTVELIRSFALGFLDPGDEAIVAEPSFTIYTEEFKLHGAKVITVRLKEDMTYDLETMLAKVTPRTKVIVICSPNNPTGTIVSNSQLVNFLERLNGRTLVILDEAYFEFVEDETYHDGVKLLRSYPNLIVMRTMSKAYGLAGLRIGYAVADPTIISAFEKVRLPFNLSRLAQKAALIAIEQDEYVRKLRARIIEEKEYLYSELDALNLKYIKSHTNFVPIYVGDDKVVAEELLKMGLIVRPGYQFKMPGYLRVTVSAIHEDNVELINGLKTVMKATLIGK